MEEVLKSFTGKNEGRVGDEKSGFGLSIFMSLDECSFYGYAIYFPVLVPVIFCFILIPKRSNNQSIQIRIQVENVGICK